ncbi:hemagglutinin/hemolysin-related protein [Leifsonia xyli subsp. xyli str. CTCB07]|uniref:Hemagglutinin/hemolysin-related protein n=2 Tax=Leifsonia xyli TaxID=1575 RepID=Q6AEL3_LEIXX|nr:hemagglutinin/hemolysin-related protein [Leifsonia xyli subsp. xyli str. CTCB07]
MSNTRRRLLASTLFLALTGGSLSLALPAQAASSPQVKTGSASSAQGSQVAFTVTSPTNGATITRPQLTITGTAKPGTEVAIGKGSSPWAGGIYYGSEIADDRGNWSLTTPAELPFTTGQHQLWALGMTWTPNGLDSMTEPVTFSVTVPDKSKPPVAKPGQTLVVTNLVDGATVVGPEITISGTARPGSVVIITLKNSPQMFGDAWADAQGNWSVTNPIALGAHELVLKGQGEETSLSLTVVSE